MKKNKEKSLQEWLPFEDILENGIIRLKNKSYVKIIKIIPINYNLKSDLEKEAILNSYKLFLKTCQFDIQILIQSNKEDLSHIISKIKNQNKKENNNNILKLSENYINFIQKLNQEKKSSSKNFYILIKYFPKLNEIEINKKMAIDELNDRYLKIKECLLRCGNYSIAIDKKEEIIKLLIEFFNKRKILKNNN